MIKELNNKTTNDDIIGVFKVYGLIVLGLCVLTSIIMAIAVS